MTPDQATKRPWRVDYNQYDQQYRVYDASGTPVVNAMFRGKDAKADCETIVAAVNERDAVLAQNQAMREVLTVYIHDGRLQTFSDRERFRSEAQAAIALEGKE